MELAGFLPHLNTPVVVTRGKGPGGEMSSTQSNWAVVNRRSPESDHCQCRHRYRVLFWVSVSPALSIVVSGIGST